MTTVRASLKVERDRCANQIFASIFPRQPPRSWILSSINAEADAAGTGFFMFH